MKKVHHKSSFFLKNFQTKNTDVYAATTQLLQKKKNLASIYNRGVKRPHGFPVPFADFLINNCYSEFVHWFCRNNVSAAQTNLILRLSLKNADVS